MIKYIFFVNALLFCGNQTVFAQTISSGACPQQLPKPTPQPYEETVNIDHFDFGDQTYSGNVVISSNYCPGIIYDIRLPFAGVKSPESAREQIKGEADKIKAKIRVEVEQCNGQ